MSDEFEDQFKTPSSDLGELTDAISIERGEYWGAKKDPDSPQGNDGGIFPGTNRYIVPPDVAAENTRRELEGQIHSPKIQQLVESTFDTRPVNARDFHKTGSVNVNTDEDFNIDPTQFDFEIPSGYIGILRNFKYYTDIPIVPDVSSYLSVSILVDGIIHPDYEKMPLGQNSNGMIPIHALVNENKIISLQFHPTEAYALATPTLVVKYFVTLYGNLLLSRGLPLEFENISQTKR